MITITKDAKKLLLHVLKNMASKIHIK